MVKTRLWMALCATPVVIASAFCATPTVIASVGNFSWLGTRQELSPERMMSIARTFERQGRTAEAKKLYEQILAQKPGSEEARRRLTKIMADAQGANRKPASAVVTQNRLPKSSMAGTAPAVVPTPASRVDSSPVQRPPSSLDQRPTQANPLEYVPPSPKPNITTAAHWESPKASATELNRPSAMRDVRIQPAAHGSTALPEEHSFVSPTSGTTSKNESGTQDERLLPIINSPSGADARSMDRRSGTPSPEAMRGEFEPGLSRPSAKTRQSVGSRTPQGSLLRSAELRPFFRIPCTQLVDMLWERRAHLKPHLVQVATDESFHLEDRTLAVFLLGMLGSEAADALPRLRSAMRTTDDSYLQIDLAQTVLLIQPEDAEAIDVLMGFLHTPDDTVQWYAAFALKNSASSRTTFVVDALLETLTSGNHRLNRMVYLTLGAFGPAAVKAVPQLEAALDSPDPMTRVIAEASLRTIVPGHQRSLSVVQKPQLNQLGRFD
jgi:HEAT repeat protein/tetratricopeptide repeat protein